MTDAAVQSKLEQKTAPSCPKWPEAMPVEHAPFYRCWDQLSETLAADGALRDRLRQAAGPEEMGHELRRLAERSGLALDGAVLRRHIDRVVRVEEPLSLIKPDVDIDLANFRGLLKGWIVTLWFWAQAAEWTDTPPFGGRLRWLWDRLGLRSPVGPTTSRSPGEDPTMARDYTQAELAAMRTHFNALGDQSWRLHIDWEDQGLGPMVYNEGLHGGARDPRYLDMALATQQYFAAVLGQRLIATDVEHLHHIGVGYRGEWTTELDPAPRHLWRLWDLMGPELLHQIDRRHVRILKHRQWEVTAFMHSYGKDMERFRRDNGRLAALFERRYGATPQLTPKMLDRAFMRIQVSIVTHRDRRGEVLAAIERRLDAFYDEIAPLDRERRALQPEAADRLPDAARDHIAKLEAEQTLALARLHKWFEYLHPYYDGNTRLSCLILNKLLVDYGFAPALLAQRNDAPYNVDLDWRRNIIEGMERFQAMRYLHRSGLLDAVLAWSDIDVDTSASGRH